MKTAPNRTVGNIPKPKHTVCVKRRCLKPLDRFFNGAVKNRRSIGRGTVQQGHGFARLMTVSARFRVKSDPAGLVDLMVFHILNTFCG